jgi:hypothetical protein
MRAYKFLDAHFGLKSLYERRLKQSRIHELNDPFELTPYDLTDLTLRKTFHQTRDDMDKDKGVVCFSQDWINPVIWAHYTDKHTGLCLGFEIPDKQGDPANDEIDHVEYIAERLQAPDFSNLSDSEHIAFSRKVIFTKFEYWKYEQEIRFWATLQNKDKEDDLYFLEFGEKLRLTEVIIGQNCKLPRTAIARALGPLTGEVKISRARAAHDRFAMVEDEQGP